MSFTSNEYAQWWNALLEQTMHTAQYHTNTYTHLHPCDVRMNRVVRIFHWYWGLHILSILRCARDLLSIQYIILVTWHHLLTIWLSY